MVYSLNGPLNWTLVEHIIPHNLALSLRLTSKVLIRLHPPSNLKTSPPELCTVLTTSLAAAAIVFISTASPPGSSAISL